MRAITGLAALLFAVGATALPAGETLHVCFDKPQELTAASSRLKIDGPFVDGKYLATGQTGLAIPAKPLLGEHAGTVLLRFKEPVESKSALVPHYFLTLRTRSRLSLSFVLFRGESRLNFSFSDRNKTFSFRFPEAFTYGREHEIGFTYDGATVGVYFDGVLASRGEQPLPLSNEILDKLYIGPVKDGWIVHKPWGDETLASELRVWNEALDPGEIARLSGVKFVPLCVSHPPRLTVPARLGEAPQIDGELQDAVWKYAASMPRLACGKDGKRTGTLPPHRLLLTHDESNLFLGFETLFPAGTSVQARSESFEFHLQSDSKLYRFGGNIGDDLQRNAPWNFKSTVHMRIDDSLQWQSEAAIPWKTLDLKGAPKRPVKFNLSHNWELPGGDTRSSLFGGAEDLVELSFVPEGPVLQLLEQNDPAGGSYQQKFAVASARAGTVNYRFALGRLDGSAAPLELLNRSFQLATHEVYTEEVTTRMSNPGYDCLLYTLTRGSEVTLRALVPFELREEYLAVKSLFLSEKLMVSVATARLAGKSGGILQARLVLTGPSGQVISSELVQGSEITIPFPHTLPAGAYKLSLLQAANGECLAIKELNYPGIGSWEKLTFDNRIVPPFTKLETSTIENGLTATLWNRTYRWEKGLFPVEMGSGGTSLLSAPVSLVANGQTIKPTRFATGAAADHRVEFTAAGEDEQCAIQEKGWLEYDGVIWSELEVEAKKPLREVKLVVTLPNSVAKYIHASGLGSWSSQVTAAIQRGERSLRFFPVVWLGREDKGLCFFAESRRNWLSPERTSLTLTKKDQTTLEAHLATELKPGAKLRFEFGLLASPVKPLPRNYPLNTLSSGHVVAMNQPGQVPTSDVVFLTESTGADLGSFFGDLPTEFGSRVHATMIRGAAQAKQFGGRPIPYTCARYLSVKYPEMAAFKDEWTFQPEIAMDYDHTGHFVYDCCPSTGASAFYIQRVQEMFRRTPDLRGIYFDFGTAGQCNNGLHGCQQRYPLLASREFYRRVALAELDAGITEPLIVVHNTDELVLPAFTYVSHLLNGERIRQSSSTLLHDRKDILDSYGLEIFAAELSSLPFGLTNSVYMPFDKLNAKYGGKEEDAPYKFRMSKAALAATLVHGTMPCLWRMHFGMFDKLVRTYAEFGVPQAKFFGYWENPARVIHGQDVYVSVYRHPRGNRLLAVIGHVGKPHVDQDLEISFDLERLQVRDLARAVDKMTEPDPGYDELFTRQKEHGVQSVRAPLDLGNFGSHVQSFAGNTLKMHLDFHSFAVVELSESAALSGNRPGNG